MLLKCCGCICENIYVTLAVRLESCLESQYSCFFCSLSCPSRCVCAFQSVYFSFDCFCFVEASLWDLGKKMQQDSTQL